MQVITIRDFIQTLEQMVATANKLDAKQKGRVKEQYRVGT